MIWQLIHKDILRKLKSPLAIIALTVMPLVFTTLMGLVFAPGNNQSEMPKIRLLIEDYDNSTASNFLTGAFNRDQMAELFQVEMITDSSGRKRMNDGKASALLIIPKDFGDSVLNNKQVELQLIKNPAQAFGPKIAEEVIDVMAEAGNRLLRLADSPLGTIQKAVTTETELSDAEMALLAVQFYQLSKKFKNYIFPPKIELNTREEAQEDDSDFDMGRMFAFILAGIVVMTLLFSLEVLARDMFYEQETRTLYRLLVSPVNLLSMICAKLVFFVFFAFVSHTLVWLVADLFMGIHMTFDKWCKLLLFSVVMLTALSSVINLIYSLVKTREQAQSVAPVVIILFSLLGGSMIPIRNLPGFIQNLTVISPAYWGIEELKNIVLNQAAWADLSQGIWVLGLIALILTSISTLLYHRKYRS